MYFINRDGTERFSAFKVTAADFNGREFDGSPFAGDHGYEWLQESLQSGLVSVVPSRQTDYAVWAVTTVDGERVLASPGDYIVRSETSPTLYVCQGPLWELLTYPGDAIQVTDPCRQPGTIDIRDKAGNVTGHAWVGQEIQIGVNELAYQEKNGVVTDCRQPDTHFYSTTRREAYEKIEAARKFVLEASAGRTVDWRAGHAKALEEAKAVFGHGVPPDFYDVVAAVNNLIGEHYRNG